MPKEVIPAEQVANAVGQIVESMYFREANYLGTAQLAGPVVAASVAFGGTVNGSFCVALSPRIARELTADFLVAEPDDISGEQAVFTVRELANIVCGTVLAAWNPTATFDFDTPRDADRTAPVESFQYAFALDGARPEMAVDISFA